jgi:hypothetical protein
MVWGGDSLYPVSRGFLLSRFKNSNAILSISGATLDPEFTKEEILSLVFSRYGGSIRLCMTLSREPGRIPPYDTEISDALKSATAETMLRFASEAGYSETSSKIMGMFPENHTMVSYTIATAHIMDMFLDSCRS